MSSPNSLVLWGTQGLYILFVVLNTWLWGLTINQIGQMQLSATFFTRIIATPTFDLAMIAALSATFVTYYARASLGQAKGSLFYSLGTVALVATSYYTLGERFTMSQALGIVLIMAGVVLVS